jgi:hypothetical protein
MGDDRGLSWVISLDERSEPISWITEIIISGDNKGLREGLVCRDKLLERSEILASANFKSERLQRENRIRQTGKVIPCDP